MVAALAPAAATELSAPGGAGMEATSDRWIKRLMLFRLVMITTLLLVAVYVEAVSETLLRINPLYFLIAATYGLTLVHVLALRLVASREALVFGQVVGDLALTTGLVYFTGAGDTRTGFMLLYPISVLSGTLFLGRRGLALAGIATGFYGALLWAVCSGAIPPQGLGAILGLPGKQIIYSIFIMGVSCATVAMIGGFLAESLRTTGLRLEEAEVHVADLQELNTVIVDSIQSGLLTADASGRILFVNGVGASILGHPAAELRGRRLWEVLGSPLLEAAALRARAANRGLARLDLAYRRGERDTLELGVSVSPLETADPRRVGYLLTFQDLTEIKRLEHQVRMKEKLAAVGEMASYLAHEIRNPLGSISGSAQVLMSEPNISPDQARLLAIITHESRRLSETLNQFLFQARPSTSVLEPVDLGPVISRAVTLLRNGPEVGPRHAVECQVVGGPHLCLADPDQISQVFWNLARNALEAMPEGGLLTVRLAASGGELVLSIRDQGRGIGREEQKRMFEPFQSNTRMGTGLGLAIVYRIVREHRGDIAVHSVPFQGTDVEVRLPLVVLPVPV